MPAIGINLQGAGELVEAVGGLAGQIRSAITGDLSPEAKAKLEEAALAADSVRDIAQAKVNEAEATGGWWRSGWRPGVGWVCVLSLAYNYIAAPVIAWATGTEGPKVELGELYPLLLGLLGLSGMRTWEKVKGGK